jgi:hypothetical protein
MNIPLARQSFWKHLMNSYVTWVTVNLVSVRLEMVLVSVQVHGLHQIYHRLGNHFG